MLKSLFLPILTGTSLALLAGQGAFAAPDANHPQGSFRAVVNMGFQVVSTEAIPAEVAQSVGMNAATAITIVTLQKGPAVAVCTFSTKSWIFMLDADLESASACDYRDYSSATPPPAGRRGSARRASGSGSGSRRACRACRPRRPTRPLQRPRHLAAPAPCRLRFRAFRLSRFERRR